MDKKLSYDRGTPRHSKSVEILSTAVLLYEKSHLKRLQHVNDLDGHSRSSESQLFDRPYVTSYWESAKATSLSCTVSETLPLFLKCTRMSVTLGSPSVSMRRLKSQATCAFWFMWKHIKVNTCYISRGIGVRKVPNSKSNFQGHSRSLVSFDRLCVWFPIRQTFHCNYVSVVPFPRYCQLFPKKIKEVILPRTRLLWGILSRVC